MSGLSPAENEEVLRELMELEREYRGRMMVRSKCQPQIMRHAMEADPESPLLRYGTRCPCGVYYCRITPEGKITPCPYMSVVAGDLREHDFGRIWRSSSVFTALREGTLGGRCGRCEYRELCGGCRARAFAESGDYLGPDDSCLYEPSGEIPLLRPTGALIYGESGLGKRSAAGPPPDGVDRDRPLRWTPEAEERLRRIPSFVRDVVTARLENYARERGYTEIDLALMAQVRQSLPVDFSKRLPFFLAGEKESP